MTVAECIFSLSTVPLPSHICISNAHSSTFSTTHSPPLLTCTTLFAPNGQPSLPFSPLISTPAQHSLLPISNSTTFPTGFPYSSNGVPFASTVIWFPVKLVSACILVFTFLLPSTVAGWPRCRCEYTTYCGRSLGEICASTEEGWMYTAMSTRSSTRPWCRGKRGK
ncbi:MAG: hypothetical protein Q9207_008390 [Kuettlingeria erythrocarpa]